MMEDAKIRQFIGTQAADFHSASVLNLRNRRGAAPETGGYFSAPPPDSLPIYLKKTWELRKNPASFVPWAKTAIIFALPFSKLPNIERLLPQTEKKEICGLVSGYSGRKLVYHLHLEIIIAKFADSLKKIIGRDFRSEICIDTKPVAEKVLAVGAGIGTPGYNTCILVPGAGSTVFIGELFLSEEIPEMKIGKTETMPMQCPECSKCLGSCPTGALRNAPDRFNYTLCRCFLTMEKKGDFLPEEKRLLGDWIFGCDLCVADCPGSDPVEPLGVDLEWILGSADSEIEDLIRGTAMEYAGAKRLKRNAGAVLENRR